MGSNGGAGWRCGLRKACERRLPERRPIVGHSLECSIVIRTSLTLIFTHFYRNSSSRFEVKLSYKEMLELGEEMNFVYPSPPRYGKGEGEEKEERIMTEEMAIYWFYFLNSNVADAHGRKAPRKMNGFNRDHRVWSAVNSEPSPGVARPRLGRIKDREPWSADPDVVVPV
ncbi:hypothetical protein CDL15_Pgr006156 [Punica granatum]|uniref:Uncharacterized protein n=1 Tax=Punica granatum TaxID=22663 RepID=A0A218VTK6_PUNGR|nr:hypothetical protein CDL15_Pgr006156 [Punica granatum]